MSLTTTSLFAQEAVAMGLRSRIPELLAAKGWDPKQFAAYCMLEGLSADTANRLARGDTDARTKTLAKVAKVLGVTKFDDMIIIDPSCDDQS